MSVIPVYAIEEYYSGTWQPVASANTERGIIENLIDLHNDPDAISEGAYRLVYIQPHNKEVLYTSTPKAPEENE